MKRVFVASPFKGETFEEYQNNLRRARAICLMIANQGHAPFAPHLFYPQFLDDRIPEQRDLGLRAGLLFLATCDELWAFGKPTSGMLLEIAEAEKLSIPVHSWSDSFTEQTVQLPLDQGPKELGTIIGDVIGESL